MIFLTLSFLAIATLMAIATRNIRKQPLLVINASLFLTLFIFFYSPQVSSIFFESLKIDKLLITTVLFTLFFGVLFRLGSEKSNLENSYIPKFSEVFGISQIHAYLFVILVLISSLIAAWAIHHLSDFGFDGYAYHTSAMAWFNQHDTITNETLFIPWVNAYPKNIELLSLWIYKFDGNDQYVEGANLMIHLISIPFVFGLGRLAGLSKAGSLVASCIYFLIPMSLAQLRSTNIDQAFSDCVAMALYFLIYWIKNCTKLSGWKSLTISLLIGLSVGNLAQIKGSGLYLWIILGSMTVPLLIFENKGSLTKLFWLKVSKCLAFSFLVAIVCGSGWYVKNYLVHGNPFWPMQLKLPFLGEIFPGTTIERLILNNWGVGDRSWIDIYWQQFTETLSRPLDIDNRTGGFGFHFFAIGLPSLVLSLVWGNTTVRWLACFAILYFFIVPASFWPRYSIAVTISTAITSIWICEKIIKVRKLQNVFNYMSLFTVIIGVLPLLEIFSITKDRFVHKEWCGNRYKIIEQFEPTTIALCNILPPETGMWYLYFGEQWKNKIVKFEKDKMKEYPFIACRMNKQFDFLKSDSRFTLINVDSTTLNKGKVGQISLFMNLNHPNNIVSKSYTKHLPLPTESNQGIIRIGKNSFFESEITILDSRNGEGNFSKDLTSYSIPRESSMVQLTVQHLGNFHPNGTFKFHVNSNFTGGHQINLNRSDKSQFSSETFWCPVINGKIHLSVKSDNEWNIKMHGFSN